MIVDANLLLYATDDRAPQQRRSRDWLTSQLGGPERVGLPWPSLLAFVRIATNPRLAARPLSAAAAWGIVRQWLAFDTVWLPAPTERHADVLGGLVTKYGVTGNLVPDAHLAALAVEHGVAVASTDTDFARFAEVRWINPLAG